MADDGKSAANQADATAREAAGAARDAGGAMRDGAQRAGEAMQAGGRKVAENSSQIGVKMIDQAQTNTQEAFEAMRRAAQAKDLTEVMRIQGDYMREQSTRSMGQAREIGEMIMQFGRDAVSGMRGGGQA